MLVTSSIPPKEAARRSHRERANREEWPLRVELPLAVGSHRPPLLDFKKKKKDEEEAMITFLHF